MYSLINRLPYFIYVQHLKTPLSLGRAVFLDKRKVLRRNRYIQLEETDVIEFSYK